MGVVVEIEDCFLGVQVGEDRTLGVFLLKSGTRSKKRRLSEAMPIMSFC